MMFKEINYFIISKHRSEMDIPIDIEIAFVYALEDNYNSKASCQTRTILNVSCRNLNDIKYSI